jgi:8-oxo-dGTP pyrophosphatase MutT (NUDIX family)
MEVALIRVRSLRDRVVWGLPKGGREEGEDAETTALREVREETGLEAKIIGHLDDVTYWFVWPPEQIRYRKTVHLFLMLATGGDITKHDDEVEEVRFVPVSEAVRLVAHKTDRQVLKRAAELAAGMVS